MAAQAEAVPAAVPQITSLRSISSESVTILHHNFREASNSVIGSSAYIVLAPIAW